MNRIKWIDYAKGIGLIFVILGHCISLEMRNNIAFAKLVYESIYYFHMPLMFYISGRTFALTQKKHQDNNVIDYWWMRFRNYLIPYFSYAVTVRVLFSLASLIPYVKRVMDNTSFRSNQGFFYGLFTGNNTLSLHVWYLYVLFFMSFITFVIFKIFGSKNIVLYCVLMGISLFLHLIRPGELLNTWFGLFMFMEMYFWFCFGLAIDVGRLNGIVVTACVALFALVSLTFFNDTERMRMLEKYVYVFFIIFVIIKLCVLLEQNGKLEFLRTFGNKSMGYYLFHQPFCASVVVTVLYKLLPGLWAIPVVLAFFTSIVVPRIILFVINKYKLNIISRVYLGKKC